MMRVVHVTRLGYAEPVVEAHTEIRKSPVDTGLQRVLTHKLEVDPVARLSSYIDYFGSHVHHFNLLEPHQHLCIRSEAIVQTKDAVCCGPTDCDDARPWQERMTEYLNWSPSVPALAEYAEIDHGVRLDLGPDAFVDSIREIGAIFHERFHYDPYATDVHSSPARLFAVGGGVCQDLAHAMIGVLRHAGVPARYVSGYVYNPSDADGDAVIGASASHAWVQVWHPELGWVGIDPTNDKLVDWQYVRVAVGRDYTDVQPLRGVFVGVAAQQMSVEVQVDRIG